MQPAEDAEPGRDSSTGAEEFLQHHQWIAAWKKPEQRKSSPQRSMSGGKLRPAYDSALESYGAGTTGKAGRGKAGRGKAAPHASEVSVTRQATMPVQKPSEQPAVPPLVKRTDSERLLSMVRSEQPVCSNTVCI